MSAMDRDELVGWFEDDESRYWTEVPVVDAKGKPWIITTGAFDTATKQVLSLLFTGFNAQVWYYPPSRFNAERRVDERPPSRNGVLTPPFRLLVPKADPEEPVRWLTQEEFNDEMRQRQRVMTENRLRETEGLT